MMSVKSKNIHVLPTDKPSRLHYNEFEELVFTPKSEQLDGVNIYITFDEPAYPYALHLKNQEVFKTRAVGANSLELYHDKGFSYPEECKKIILTTDQDLIKDGVQEIDDEFLEWFVNNPSCDEVEVERWTDYRLKNNKEVIFFNYKIIIPKEETERGITITHVAKQETLEEAAEKYDSQYVNRLRPAFIAGAKWQQEQIGNSEFLQKLRATISDAEARRLIFEQFKKK